MRREYQFITDDRFIAIIQHIFEIIEIKNNFRLLRLRASSNVPYSDLLYAGKD